MCIAQLLVSIDPYQTFLRSDIRKICFWTGKPFFRRFCQVSEPTNESVKVVNDTRINTDSNNFQL